MSSFAVECPLGLWDVPLPHRALGSHGTFHLSLVWARARVRVRARARARVRVRARARARVGLGLGVRARAGTGGTSYEIPRYRERMGWDGQEGPRIFQTWDWWYVSRETRTSYDKVGQPSRCDHRIPGSIVARRSVRE